MSDLSKTAPTISNQIFRASVLIAFLGESTWIPGASNPSNHTVVLIHLLAFSSWFGCSIWVTFVAGIVIFKTLLRHVFGRL